MEFLQQKAYEVSHKLNQTIRNDKGIINLDMTQKTLKKLRSAKVAISQLIRAIKKQDYLMLKGDRILELEQIRPYVPEIS